MSGNAPSRASGIVEIDRAELIVRVIEALGGIKRLPGTSAVDVLKAVDPEVLFHADRVSRAACGYFAECLADMKRPS